MVTPRKRRILDFVFLGYFLFQIPSTIFFDTQGVYPEWLYPGFLRSLRTHYLESYRDPFLANAWDHPWYLAVCLVEHYIEVPFFFFATWAYFKGALNVPSVVILSFMYSVHTVTAVISIWFMAMMQDFGNYNSLSPRDTGERIKLCSAYAPFLLFSLLNIFDNIRLLWKSKKD